MKYFKRRWDETRSNADDAWGSSDWYFEVDDVGRVIRQLERYENGTVLTYDAIHLEDEFGGLSAVPLDLQDFRRYEIEASEFTSTWSAASPKNRS